MKALLMLASPFIERAVDPQFGAATNEDYAARLDALVSEDELLSGELLDVESLAIEDVASVPAGVILWHLRFLVSHQVAPPQRYVRAVLSRASDPTFRFSVVVALLRVEGLGVADDARFSVQSTLRAYAEAPLEADNDPYAENRHEDGRDEERAERQLEVAAALLEFGDQTDRELLAELLSWESDVAQTVRQQVREWIDVATGDDEETAGLWHRTLRLD